MGPIAHGPTGTGRSRRAGQGENRGGASVRGARRRARRAVGSNWISLSYVWLPKTQIFETQVDQVINSKVVDLLFLYNFGKGHRVFFSTICAQIGCQDFLGASEQCRTALTEVFHLFTLQISNATQHESCVPRQNTQLCIGRIWSV
jgi:hypothetical protein